MHSRRNDTSGSTLRSRAARAALVLAVVAGAAGLWHPQSASAASGVTVQLSAAVSGQSVTLTADVLGLPVLDTTGTVSFYESGNSAALNSSGILLGGTVADQTASFSLANVSPGTHTYSATYRPSFSVGALSTVGFGPFQSTNATVNVVNTSPPPAFTTQVTLTSDATGPVDPTQTVTFTATVARVPSSNGTPSGGTVAFNDIGSGLAVPVITDSATDNGQKVPIDANGVASISVQLPASPSPHEIVASYSGSATDASSSTVSPLQLTMTAGTPVTTTTTVVVSPTSIAAGDTVTMTATLDISGSAPTPPTGNVTFSAVGSTGSVTLAAVPLGSSMDSNGNLTAAPAANEAVLQWPSWTADTYSVVAAYSGNYPASHGSANLSVGPTRSATDLAYLGDTTAEYGHTATLSARVTDRGAQGAPLANRTVTFTVGSQTCSGVSDSTGLASCTLAVQQDVGTPGVTASVAQDLTTSAKSITAPFSVTPQPTTLTTSYAPGLALSTLSATLLGDLETGVPGQTVTLTLGGETCSGTTDASGAASCQVTTITTGATAALDGAFAGSANGDYLASSARTKIVQLVVDTTLAYQGDTTAVYEAAATLAGTLAQADGTKLANRTVTFTLGAQACTATTDGSGYASCTIAHVQQDAGAATVTASYAGDGVTNPSSASEPFTVTPAPTTTVTAAPTVGTSTTGLSATLTSNGTPLAGRMLTLAFGASSCPAATDSNGVASCSVPTPAGASATFTATFAGETDYSGSSDSRPVTLLAPSAITYVGVSGAEYSDPALLAAHVTSADGHAVPNGEAVTFTLGSQTCTGRTLLGYAFCFLTVDQPAGPATVVVSYGGDSTYSSSTANAPFAVRLEDTSIRVTTGPALAGSSTTLGATLLQDGGQPVVGRTVTLTLGSQSCTAVTGAAGSASCPVTASSVLGPATATATFAGDAYYAGDADSAQAIVYAYAPGGGSFVIGDRSTTGVVTFWGSQWAKENSLSGGAAPSAFKGFALHASAQCGTTWSTDPGNSAPPPAGPLPSYMAVIVATSAAKSGPTISGNTFSVVVVKTNSGYAANPGHAGTGTVVATVCGPSNDSRTGGGTGGGAGCGR